MDYQTKTTVARVILKYEYDLDLELFFKHCAFALSSLQ